MVFELERSRMEELFLGGVVQGSVDFPDTLDKGIAKFAYLLGGCIQEEGEHQVESMIVNMFELIMFLILIDNFQQQIYQIEGFTDLFGIFSNTYLYLKVRHHFDILVVSTIM